MNEASAEIRSVSMNWNKWIRQFHRWLAVAFTVGFIINVFAAAGKEQPAFWVYLLALIPLFLLLPTGLYLFALPYVSRRRHPVEIMAGYSTRK